MSYNVFHLTTQPYPLEVNEAAAVAPLAFSVAMWSNDVDPAAVAALTFSGELEQTLFPGEYDELAEAQVAPLAFSGTLAQTLFPAAYDELAEAQVAALTFSGTHVQTLFPLAHTAETQTASVAAPTFTGTLV